MILRLGFKDRDEAQQSSLAYFAPIITVPCTLMMKAPAGAPLLEQATPITELIAMISVPDGGIRSSETLRSNPQSRAWTASMFGRSGLATTWDELALTRWGIVPALGYAAMIPFEANFITLSFLDVPLSSGGLGDWELISFVNLGDPIKLPKGVSVKASELMPKILEVLKPRC